MAFGSAVAEIAAGGNNATSGPDTSLRISQASPAQHIIWQWLLGPHKPGVATGEEIIAQVGQIPACGISYQQLSISICQWLPSPLGRGGLPEGGYVTSAGILERTHYVRAEGIFVGIGV
jgi:hypothetical protein